MLMLNIAGMCSTMNSVFFNNNKKLSVRFSSKSQLL